MKKPKVLAACPPSVMPILARVLGAHVDFIFVNALAAAGDVLRTAPDLSMVICGVHFDDSRMYDLLNSARRKRPDLPFLCVRILDTEIPRSSPQGIALAVRDAGAVGFVDFASVVIERGLAAAEHELEEAVIQQLKLPSANG